MLLQADIQSKKVGPRELFRELSLTIQPGEKLAIIGRNGVGKTTLFNILSGADDQFHGHIQRRRGLEVVATKQEFEVPASSSCIDYVIANLPHYTELKEILDSYPKTMGDNVERIAKYSEAVEQFSRYGYYDIEPRIIAALEQYQIPAKLTGGAFNSLSGGQKRFVELVRVELSGADLALVDEPTNHMDYVAKEAFINWLKAADEAVVVITHDRDVLATVDRIVELKELAAQSFKGNYDNYLRQNSVSTIGAVGQYEVGLKTIDRLKKQIAYARSQKAKWGGTADKKNPFVVMEQRAQRQLDELQANLQKPSFWIDRESIEQMHDKVVEKYHRYKAKNIRIHNQAASRYVDGLLRLQDVSVGYDQPLLRDVSFALSSGDRLQLRGRNGVGKSTIVRAIIAAVSGQPGPTKLFGGQIKFNPKLKIGIYQQEVDPKLLDKQLDEAVAEILETQGAVSNQQRVKQILADYLFDPRVDAGLPVRQLSGGQKARLQIIRLLAGEPNLLILDEPTNHLDLPSIEELEKALSNYDGAILYVSHDSYFADNIGGEVLELS